MAQSQAAEAEKRELQGELNRLATRLAQAEEAELDLQDEIKDLRARMSEARSEMEAVKVEMEETLAAKDNMVINYKKNLFIP